MAAPAEQVSIGPRKARKTVSLYMTFLGLNICVLLVSLDSTALSVVVPMITQNLHGATLEAFWANLCFLLAVVAVMPIITSLSDVLGRKIPLYASFVIFLTGSIVFAVANNMSVLIVGPVLQGLGGGGLDVLGEVVLTDITTFKERPLYLGLFSIPMAGGAICGPIVGAALAEYATWRWIGWINIPLGMILYLIGSTLFSLPLSWAGALYPWVSYRTLIPFILGLTVLTTFGIYEARPIQPVFPYRIFKSRTAAATLIGSFTHGAATFRDTLMRSAIEVLPVCVFIVVFSIAGALAVEFTRKYKLLTIAAWPCLVVGLGLFALWKPGISDGLKYGPQILTGTGLGIVFTITTFPMNASQAVDDADLTIGIMISFRMFGGMTGLRIGSTAFHNVFERRIADIGGGLSSVLGILRDVREALGFIPLLREFDSEVLGYGDVMEAYRVSFMAVFLALAGLGAVGFVFSFFVRELSLRSEEVGRQGFEES
ncbi:major facilitator superfamily domain-containing protein [Aspergillus multicolor]|uniref:major facilitator superfamily domain-containing protein n=1 Tax=Aspergillus multicolor TaxID=41759 RepID=UPI003CCE3660